MPRHVTLNRLRLTTRPEVRGRGFDTVPFTSMLRRSRRSPLVQEGAEGIPFGAGRVGVA